VAELSGITYDRMRGSYVLVADRAGTTPAHVFTLGIPLSRGSMGVPVMTSATLLNQPSGMPFNGLNFDGEGIALSGGGQLRWVASEGGSAAGEQPEIHAFTRDGTHVTALEVPANFQIGANNLSFESLAISRNGRSLFTVNEAPLAIDGRTADFASRVRILRYEDGGPGGFQPAEQYFYLSEPGRSATDLGIAEVIALSEKDLLVLERGFVAGAGNTIRVFKVSLEDAEDVSDQPSLAAPGLEPVTKELVFDLAECPPSGAATPPGAVQPNPLLDNFEAMTLGPALSDGRRALILASDDNSSDIQATRLVVLAVSVRSLVGEGRVR
ncbi:MAG TPA: esterase-like activity of phytase family protein, partial [Dehalococcoidia bacterium]|nr:esterase-like activity of phytase family protein [Dehalococcoidia bacterium]